MVQSIRTDTLLPLLKKKEKKKDLSLFFGCHVSSRKCRTGNSAEPKLCRSDINFVLLPLFFLFFFLFFFYWGGIGVGVGGRLCSHVHLFISFTPVLSSVVCKVCSASSHVSVRKCGLSVV